MQLQKGVSPPFQELQAAARRSTPARRQCSAQTGVEGQVHLGQAGEGEKVAPACGESSLKVQADTLEQSP